MPSDRAVFAFVKDCVIIMFAENENVFAEKVCVDLARRDG